MNPQISVIIPTFRRPEPLVEAVESVLAQKGAACEIRVIDDCPEGSAEAVVAPYRDRGLSYLRAPQPSGGRPARVRNFGWREARADILHFLDDDDLVPDGFYADALQTFAQRPDIGVVFGKVEPFGDGDVSGHRAYFDRAHRRAQKCRRMGRIGFSAAMFFQDTLLVCSAAMIRKPCVAGIGGFDDGPAVAEDVDFYARAIRKFGAALLDRPSVRYRIGPSIMRQPDCQSRIEDSYRHIHARYLREHGRLDYYAMKTFARLLDKIDGLG